MINNLRQHAHKSTMSNFASSNIKRNTDDLFAKADTKDSQIPKLT